MPPRPVIFDLDGTIVESALDFDAIRREIGLGQWPILEALAELSGEPRRRAEDILRRHEDFAASGSVLIEGAAELIGTLRRAGRPVALMTRNSRHSVEIILRRHGATLEFDLIRTREDGPFKPSPEPVLEICNTFVAAPRDAWVVGDFHYDIRCGAAAGSRTALYLAPHLPLPAWADEADVVIRRLGDLLEYAG